jgi:hypothetical protein
MNGPAGPCGATFFPNVATLDRAASGRIGAIGMFVGG